MYVFTVFFDVEEMKIKHLKIWFSITVYLFKLQAALGINNYLRTMTGKSKTLNQQVFVCEIRCQSLYILIHVVLAAVTDKVEWPRVTVDQPQECVHVA